MATLTKIAIWDAPSAATYFPGDLKGSTITAYGTAKNGTAATFTATTATATWAAGNPSTAAAGDYVFTGDGCWGVVVSGTATVVTVDRWRAPGTAGVGRNSGSGGTPVIPATTTLSIYNGKNFNAGSFSSKLHLIYVLGNGSGAASLTITDAKGTATSIVAKSIVDPGVATSPIPEVMDFGAGDGGGLQLMHPIGFTLSANVARGYVVWSDG